MNPGHQQWITGKGSVKANTTSVYGVIVEGHRVAAQKSKDYPYGTIEKQKPHFKELGLDLDRFYSGTLNVSIAPATFTMVNPAYTFRQVSWTDLHPPEDFSFSPCSVKYEGKWHDGFVYYPHPETKRRNFQHSSILEILTEYIPGIDYGEKVEIILRTDEIRLKNSTE